MQTTTYTYDTDDQRVTKLVSGITTTYPSIYYETANATTTKHIYAGGVLVASVVSTTSTSTAVLTHVHVDHLGSTAALTTDIGLLANVYTYYPYGAPRIDGGSAGGTSEPNRFIGQDYDSEAQLSYLNARYYSGGQGQFQSEDPVFWSVKQNLLDPQSLNSYSYANDNPVNKKDPEGRAATMLGILQSMVKLLTSFKNYLIATSGGGGKGGGGQSLIPNTISTGTQRKNSENLILQPSAWKTQIPNLTACFQVCTEIAGYLPTKRINTRTFVDGRLSTLPTAYNGVQAIDTYLASNKPIIVGVNENGGSESLNPNNVATQHFVVIAGSGIDNGNTYYRFYDPATSYADKGTSAQNRLYLSTPDSSISGKTAYESSLNYTVTEVRP